MKKTLGTVLLFGFGMFTLNGCGKTPNALDKSSVQSFPSLNPYEDTRTGNPLVEIAAAAYEEEVKLTFCNTGFDVTFSSDPTRTLDIVIPDSLVTILPQGSPIGNFLVPSGDYSVVDLEADGDCGGNVSVRLTNREGTFQISDIIHFKFDGRLIVSANANAPLSLNFKNYMEALREVKSSSELLTALRSVRGSF